MTKENRATAHDVETSFEARFQQLLDLTGLVPKDLVEPDDDHPEHKRYAVYQRVVGADRPELRPLLLSCLADDPDPLTASSVLVQVLELVDASQRHTVANLTRGWPRVFAGQREFVRQWARDLDTLDSLRGDEPDPAAIQALREGSDRVQRRAVQEVASVTVLELLEEHGRTRRVRGAAREKRRRIRRGITRSARRID